jgi:phage tail tape-measure protein
MGRSLIGFCAFLGSTCGSFAPELWGASSFSVASVVFAALGGVAGIWFGARLSEAWL